MVLTVVGNQAERICAMFIIPGGFFRQPEDSSRQDVLLMLVVHAIKSIRYGRVGRPASVIGTSPTTEESFVEYTIVNTTLVNTLGNVGNLRIYIENIIPCDIVT